MPPQKSRLLDILILSTIALAVRIAYTAGIVGRYGTKQIGDFDYLHRLAGSLAAGSGFTLDGDRIFNQSVGYPAFLALFYSAFGTDVTLALGVNVALGTLSVLLIYVLSLALFGWYSGDGSRPGVPTRRVALLAAGLATIYPDSLLYCATTASENLLIPLLIGMFLVTLWPTERDWAVGAATGVLAAAAASVKANIVLSCVLLPLVWVASGRRSIPRTLAAAAAAGVCLAPWTYINYRDSGGHLVPFAAVAGEVFLDGTNPRASGQPSGVTSLGADVEAGRNKIEVDRMKMSRAVGYIQERPAWYARLLLLKFAYSLSPARDYMFEEGGQARLFTIALSRWAPTLYNAAIMLGTAVGCLTLRGRPVPLTVAASLALGMFGVQVVFAAYARYRFPFLFCLLPYAALGWLAILGKARRRPLVAVGA